MEARVLVVVIVHQRASVSMRYQKMPQANLTETKCSMRKKFRMSYWKAKCTFGNNRLPFVIRSRSANRLAANARAVRNAVLSEQVSRVTRASIYSECIALHRRAGRVRRDSQLAR
eukprot:8131977-Pyramimonas_sp.AAC.1